MASVLGIYSKPPPPKGNAVRIGTPDPNKYHQPDSVEMEGSHRKLNTLLPGGHGFSGLRGVIIPHATADGGSRGHNHHAKTKVYVDPELTGGRLVVDMAKIKPGQFARIRKQKAMEHVDNDDVAIATLLEVAESYEPNKGPTEITMKEGSSQMVDPMREPPIQMPGSYVVPKASIGGGQLNSEGRVQDLGLLPAASFTQPAAFEVQRTSQFMGEQVRVPERSLQRALADEPAPQVVTRQQVQVQPKPMKCVVFEIPVPGQPAENTGHQFTAYYHDVLKYDGMLVLVYDHSQATQMVYFPPEMTGSDGNPLGIAALVKGPLGQGDTLYRIFVTGIRFTRNGEEFCVLTTDKEKKLDNGAQ